MGLSMPSITFDPNRNSWLARATIAGVQKTLGRFKTELEAQQAVDAALREAAVTEAARIKTTWIAVPPGWEKLKHHPYACVVEFGAGINLDALAAHMRDHGYDADEPIILYRESPKHEARILAGRHRHEAAKMAGVTPSFRVLEGKDDAARAYALKDIHRRHLTESQRAMIAAALATMKKSDNQHSSNEVSGIPLTSQKEAANALNVSVDTIKQAKKVIANGTPELQAAVMDNTVSVSDAAKVADKPPEVQNQAVKDVKAGKTRTASASANGKHKGNGKTDIAGDEKELTDEEGMPVPEVARVAFEETPNFGAACREIDAVVKRVKELGEGAAGRLTNVASIVQTLQGARKALWQSRPTHVCPYCAGKDKKCTCCKGQGWTNTATYKQSPAGAQA